tara:strand:- start:12741 stop:13073 length:333 start_codon:yes stop_codon:yes gene_type:complete
MHSLLTPEKVDIIKQYAIYGWKFSGIYVIWTSVHYISAHLYVKFCTPLSFMGFIAAPFIVASPHCSGLRWCIQEGSRILTSMWVVLGSWVITNVCTGSSVPVPTENIKIE